MAASSANPLTLETVLRSSRDVFYLHLPPGLPQAECEQQFEAYVKNLVSSSQPTAPSTVESLGNDDTSPGETHIDHTSPTLTAAPPRKRPRLNSQLPASVPPRRQHSSSSYADSTQDGANPFGNSGTRVPTPQWGTTSALQKPPLKSEKVTVSKSSASKARKSHKMYEVQEVIPTPEMFGSSMMTRMPSRTSSKGHPYDTPLSPNRSSSFVASSSPYSAMSGMSFGASTSPTSHGMSRQDSLGDSSVCKGLDMIRMGSTTSNHVSSYTKMVTSPIDAQRRPSFHSTYSDTTQAVDATHNVSLIGSQFSRSIPTAAAPLMQRNQSSSSGRRLEPKANVEPSISRTSSSTGGLEMIRLSSDDGSYKDAVKIPKAAASVRPTHDRVKCTHPGCSAQPNGYKGEHEMRRHYDRSHTSRRQVFVCAPCTNDPEFLSACKACQSNKTYNADYNAGEHLRRMHFNPKKPKVRRGNLKPEERRGGKGGGDWPPMEDLREYMITYDISADGSRISPPRKVNDYSNVIMPCFAEDVELDDESEGGKSGGDWPLMEALHGFMIPHDVSEDGSRIHPPAGQLEVPSSATAYGLPMLTMNNVDHSNHMYKYESAGIAAAQTPAIPRFVDSGVAALEHGRRDSAASASELNEHLPIQGLNSSFEGPSVFDPSDPPLGFLSDPPFDDERSSNNPVLFELENFLSSF